jgi:hypothetical protein
MLRFVCDRREWLRLGGLAGLGLTAWPRRPAAAAAAERSASAPGFGRARSVILVYASGGQSQLETWDPKPDAPVEVRGEFRPTRTAVPGTLVCEHLPRLARRADLYTLVRNVAHDDLDHGSATYLALTGHFHARKSGNPPVSPTDQPTYGALLHRVRPSTRHPFTAIHVNGPAQIPEILAPGQFAGFLGRGCEPLLLGDVTQEVALRGLDPVEGLPPVRVDARRSLLQSLDSYGRQLGRERALLDMDTSARRAYELLSARGFRDAFDLGREPRAVRERYGLNRSGQSCLLARRLVEAGVPWITVIWNHNNRGQDRAPDDFEVYGWDTHNDIFDVHRDHLLPRFDQSFSALLSDLEQRGLLDSTLVVCMGEFGRAPRVALEARFAGASPGRMHWAACYSLLMAGAGVARGGVVGASDRIAAYPRTPPVGPWDVAATMFAALGVDPGSHYHDLTGRPLALTTGRPIRELYGA